jgi:uncharacterized membrane protein YphA (DoxX/SURF4 family)
MTRRSLLIALMGASGVAAATAVAQQRATPNPQDKLALADRDMLPTEKTTDRNLAYLSLRVFLGINIAVHGASRIHSGVAGFATELVSQFAKTPLPSRMVYSFAVTLPFAEALVGVLIFIGLWSRLTYSAGFLLMIALTFGSTLGRTGRLRDGNCCTRSPTQHCWRFASTTATRWMARKRSPRSGWIGRRGES